MKRVSLWTLTHTWPSGRGAEQLAGAEYILTVRFSFCNERGILLYLDGLEGFFALGINNGRIYLEWKTNHELIEVRT